MDPIKVNRWSNLGKDRRKSIAEKHKGATKPRIELTTRNGVFFIWQQNK
jgi:hypothetical protein